ncbi:MAG: hypothetical protein HY675_24230 [Chloroflexi bacterium]|nr:hypothetical protein [Chloroflexota bacterium]
MGIGYDVLSPWAEADPVPPKGISSRLAGMTDKRIGLFVNSKGAAPAMQALVEHKLKARFPSLKFSSFLFKYNLEIAGTEEQAALEEWLKGVDAVVTAVGD